MKFKDLKVGDVLSQSWLLKEPMAYYLVTKIYECKIKHEHNGKIITHKCFDCYSFYNGKIYTRETHIRGFEKSKISQMFE